MAERLLGLPFVTSPFLPFTRMVRPKAGDAHNPFPAFGLRPRRVSQQVDAVMVDRSVVGSPRVVAILTNLGRTPEKKHG